MSKSFYSSLVLILLTAVLSGPLSAQTGTAEFDLSITKDATVSSRDREVNFGDNTDFIAMSWEANADSVVLRSLIEFDGSALPAGVYIEEAWLSFYATEGSQHPGHFGSNDAMICKLVGDWDENTVNWNNQPMASRESEVLLSHTFTAAENFEKIDVTALVRDMRTTGDGNFGFALQLQAETIYKSLNFASSDHEYSDRHPRLMIKVSGVSTGIEDHMAVTQLAMFPNPATSTVNVSFELERSAEAEVHIHNLNGQLLSSTSLGRLSAGLQQHKIDLVHLATGQQLITVILDGEVALVRKLMRR